jgi:hypothetical protein
VWCEQLCVSFILGEKKNWEHKWKIWESQKFVANCIYIRMSILITKISTFEDIFVARFLLISYMCIQRLIIIFNFSKNRNKNLVWWGNHKENYPIFFKDNINFWTHNWMLLVKFPLTSSNSPHVITHFHKRLWTSNKLLHYFFVRRGQSDDDDVGGYDSPNLEHF